MDKNVLVPIANGTEEMEAVVVIDILRRAGLNVKVAGDNDIVTCSRGLKIIPDILIEKLEKDADFDAIILPGGAQGAQNLADNSHLATILEANINKGRLVGAICAAPIVLVHNGLINGMVRITSHPSIKPALQNFDYTEAEVIRDGNIITSRGAGTAIPFALELVSILVNQATANKIAGDIIYSRK